MTLQYSQINPIQLTLNFTLNKVHLNSNKHSTLYYSFLNKHLERSQCFCEVVPVLTRCDNGAKTVHCAGGAVEVQREVQVSKTRCYTDFRTG